MRRYLSAWCLMSMLAIVGCAGSTTTVVQTVTSTRSTSSSSGGTVRRQAAGGSLGNPAQATDPAVTVSCDVAPIGHACVSRTTVPSDPNQFPQRNCDTNIVANSRSSCSFANNVFYEYYRSGRGTNTMLLVHSPTTGADYTVSCSIDAGLVGCLGQPLSTGIYVSFPQRAVEQYTEAAAQAYAQSADLGDSVPATPGQTAPATGNPSGSSADFCTAHACIPNFANGTGYVVQCADGEWSHSGGRPGACSDHGGETGVTYP